jgi:energy-coupling factor transporter ATP-binding protein EcfA2
VPSAAAPSWTATSELLAAHSRGISVEGATRWYGSTLAVHDVSFRLCPGEIVGFLGPNGAGKTTLLKMISTWLPPSAGRIVVGGHDIVRKSLAVRRLLGYLREHNSLYEVMRVHRFLDFAARIRGPGGRSLRERLEWAVESCALFRYPQIDKDTPAGEKYVTTLSRHALRTVSMEFRLRSAEDFRQLREAVGLPHVHLHALRHACATHLPRGGADVRHVQAILGHRNLRTTGLYTRVVIEDLHEVLARAHRRERAWEGSRGV